MKKMKLLLLCLVAIAIGAKAQIGYQISLLNTATGEPRANETVTVSVTLSNNEGVSFYSETKSATTNDFGVLSLSIGNTDTFANVDFSKMPFFIEVTANGVMIGKSQMLSVPVAEVARKVVPIDKKLIVGTWKPAHESGFNTVLTFNEDRTGSYIVYNNDKIYGGDHFYWGIDGMLVYYIFDKSARSDWDPNRIYVRFDAFRYLDGCLYAEGEKYVKQLSANTN